MSGYFCVRNFEDNDHWSVFNLLSELDPKATTFVIFGPNGKKKMAALASDWLRHFLLVRKQDFNVNYKVCVFRADRKNKIASLASDWHRHFRLILCNR